MTQTILLIPGAGGGSWQWQFWLPSLQAPARRLVTIDLLPATVGLKTTVIDDYLQQVLDLARRIQPSILIGASMGGLLALKAAEQLPLQGLVLVNSVPPKGIDGWPVINRKFPAVVAWSRSELSATRKHLPDADAERINWVHSQWRDESGQVMAALHQGVEVDTLNVPSLVIAGAADKQTPPAIAKKIAARFSSDYLEINGVSHLGALMGEKAVKVALLAGAWIQSLERMHTANK